MKHLVKRILAPTVVHCVRALLNRLFGHNQISVVRGNTLRLNDVSLRHCEIVVRGKGNKIIMGGVIY